MTDIVIKAESLGKRYKIQHQQDQSYRTFREAIAGVFRRGGLPRKQDVEEFWALKDVNFEVARGDVVGIVGRNGAGKSTLLKVLSRITEPTQGAIELNGRVASLLEVGTGFHPELTGRENIFLNGSILGMRQQEIRRKFDEIVDFAEVERFIDTPVKRYSSGMYMRLAFSVAAHLEPEILIVDEVLAVGDSAFQKKCLGRMEEVSAGGRTVLFVSHNIGALLSICKKGILLEGGRCVMTGEIGDVVRRYQHGDGSASVELPRKLFGGPLRSVEFRQLLLNDTPMGKVWSLTPSDDVRFRILGHSTQSLPEFVSAVALYSQGVRLLTCEDACTPIGKGDFEISITLPRKLLRPGEYAISLGGRNAAELATPHEYIWGQDLAFFTVEEVWSEDYPRDNYGLVNVVVKSERHMLEPSIGVPQLERSVP